MITSKQFFFKLKLNTSFQKMEDLALNYVATYNNIVDVIVAYMFFLRVISLKAATDTENIIRHLRKYIDVKQQLILFFKSHSEYIQIVKMSIRLNGELQEMFSVNFLGSFEDILNFDPYIWNTNHLTEFFEVDWVLEAEINKDMVCETIRQLLNKEDINNEDINLFFCDYQLYNDGNVNYSTYSQQADYIHERTLNYLNQVVTAERIQDFLFVIQQTDDQDLESCNVCFEKYHTNQEICLFPCHHYLCLSCAENMFLLQQNRSLVSFTCPICRMDLT